MHTAFKKMLSAIAANVRAKLPAIPSAAVVDWPVCSHPPPHETIVSCGDGRGYEDPERGYIKELPAFRHASDKPIRRRAVLLVSSRSSPRR